MNYGQEGLVFDQGETVKYVGIDYDEHNKKHYLVNFQDMIFYLPEDEVDLYDETEKQLINEYDFDDVSLYPQSIAISMDYSDIRYPERFNGYVAKSNANDYDANTIVKVEVDNNPKLNRHVFIIDNTVQTQGQLHIMFDNDLDKRYWGQRVIKTQLVESNSNLYDFANKYLYEQIDDDSTGGEVDFE